MPAGSKMNPLLAKAKITNDIGSASGIRKGRKHCTAALTERSEKNHERMNYANTKFSEEGGGMERVA